MDVVVAFRDFPRGPGRLMEPAEPSVAELQAVLAERDRQLADRDRVIAELVARVEELGAPARAELAQLQPTAVR